MTLRTGADQIRSYSDQAVAMRTTADNLRVSPCRHTTLTHTLAHTPSRTYKHTSAFTFTITMTSSSGKVTVVRDDDDDDYDNGDSNNNNNGNIDAEG